jgi:hypothetical protein
MNTFDAAMILDGAWDLVDFEPCEENFILACQHLIDTGVAWQLQGRVGRTCAAMIDAGQCEAPA